MSESLSQLLKEHQQKQSEAKHRLRQEALDATHTLTDSLTNHVNAGMTQVFARQRELEQASRQLSTQMSRYSHQTKQWLGLVDEFNSAFKELGDVRHWVQVMEQDMRTIMATLEFAHEGIPTDTAPSSTK